MGTILVFLEIASIVGIWYFWKKKPNKKYLIWSIILLFVFGGLFSTTNSYKQETKAQKADSSSIKESTEKESKKSSSLAVASSKKKKSSSEKQSSNVSSSESISGKQSSQTKKKGLSTNNQVKTALKKYGSNDLKVTFVNGQYFDPTAKTVAIELKGSDALTDKMTTKGFLMDIRSVWIALKKSGDANNFENVNVSVKYPLQDTAGNSSNKYVVKTSVSGAKIQNLNIENFLFKNVPNYADSYWQSTALPDVN